MAHVHDHFKIEIDRKKKAVDDLKLKIQSQLDILNEDGTLNGVVAGETLKDEINEILTTLENMSAECESSKAALNKNNT